MPASAKATKHSTPHLQALEILVDRVKALAGESGGRRILLGIAGSPGGGKTTLAKAIVDAINGAEPGLAAYLPMDGFHLANSTLDRLGLHDRKGAIDTFDGWGFRALLDRIRAETGHTIYAPSFDRRVDEGVAGEIAIDDHARIVVVEGNYLLADGEPWGIIRNRFAETWFCSTPEDKRIARLVVRHTGRGRTVDAAQEWATQVDGKNAELIEATRNRADLVISGTTGEIIPSIGLDGA